MKVGIVGAGYIAGAHLRALAALPDVEVTAVCDVDLARAQALCRMWSIRRATGGVAELLEDEQLDAVHVITPPTAHTEAVLACIDAGCHVFAEKPLAPTAAECRRIEQAAERAGVEAGVNHNQSFHPAVLRLKQWASERRFGRIEHLSVCLSTGLRQLNTGQHGHWMFREPGNILLEQGPHPLSQIVRLMGSIREVSSLASGRRVLDTGKVFWDTWQIGMICERGTAQLLLAFGRDDLDNWLHVTGQDASAHADLRRNTVTFHPKRRWAPPVADLFDAASNGTRMCRQGWAGMKDYTLGFLKLRPPQDTFFLGMRGSIGAFYEALRAGRPAPVPVREGREIVEVCERIGACAQGVRAGECPG